MATVGLSKPYFALYENSGTAVTYSEGQVIGKAVELSMELEGQEPNALYADNSIAESASMFSGGTLTIKTDDLLPAPLSKALGLTLQTISNTNITTPSAQEIVYGNAQSVPFVGFGAIVKKIQSGATKWMAVIWPKIQFQTPGLSAVTQGETIEWQTPELTATIMRDDTATANWMRTALLDTEADAETYIKSFLSIT